MPSGVDSYCSWCRQLQFGNKIFKYNIDKNCHRMRRNIKYERNMKYAWRKFEIDMQKKRYFLKGMIEHGWSIEHFRILSLFRSYASQCITFTCYSFPTYRFDQKTPFDGEFITHIFDAAFFTSFRWCKMTSVTDSFWSSYM